MSNIEQPALPARIRGPGAMKAEKSRAELTGPALARTATPTFQPSSGANTTEQTFDATSGNQGPTTGSDYGPDDTFIHAAVAHQPPINLDLDGVETSSGKRRAEIHLLHPFLNP